MSLTQLYNNDCRLKHRSSNFETKYPMK